MPVVMSNTAQRGQNAAQPASASGAAASRVVPFARAAKTHIEPGQTESTTLSTSAQVLNLKIPPYGYAEKTYLVVTGTTSGNIATVTFEADAPWNVIKNLLFRDANGTPIYNISGYHGYLADKWGGYKLWPASGATDVFSTTAGSGATGGSFKFVLPLHHAFGREGLGLLANMDAAARYQLDLTLGTIDNVYGTAPTNAPTVTVQLVLQARTNPPAVDVDGNPTAQLPPGLGTVQYWSYATHSWSGTGEQVFYLPRVGQLIRNQILVFRNASGARDAAVVPASLIYEWDTGIRYSTPTDILRVHNYVHYGQLLDTGVVVLGNTLDPDHIPPGELGDSWLPTRGGTKLALRFTPGAAGSVEVLQNDISPVGDIYAY